MELETTVRLDCGWSSKFHLEKYFSRIVFVKEYDIKGEISFLKHIEKKIIPRDKFHKHIDFSLRTGSLDQELKTWSLWKEENIPTLELVKTEENKIVWNYVQAPSLRIFLEEKNSQEKEEVFSNYLATYSKIRKIALEKNNKDYFHSDPWLKNYLVLKNIVMPIDAGIKLKDNIPVEKLDICLNRISLYSIADLKVDNSEKRRYLEMFREIFTSTESANIMDFNLSNSRILTSYLFLREYVVSNIKGRKRNKIYKREKEFNYMKQEFLDDIFKK